MKILTSQQMREADAFSIENDPISSVDLMERAASICSDWIQAHFDKDVKLHVFCGMGNNGGDGLVISRLLSEQGYQIKTYRVKFSDKASADHQVNCDRIADQVIDIHSESQLEQLEIEASELIVDAIFGTGLSKPVEGISATVIEYLNRCNAFKFSIDCPSGLFSEDNSKNTGAIFLADHTLTFECPKLSFLLPESGSYVGNFSILDIGLNKEFLLSRESTFHFLNKAMLAPILHQRHKFSHKGSYGHALLVAGSTGKMGAAALAAQACLRSGVGLLSLESVKHGIEILQTLVPEAMLSLNEGEDKLEGRVSTSSFSSIAVGPGIGIEEATQSMMKLLIQDSQQPIVFDADAINILAENKTWLDFLPQGSILTPHPGEFMRLVGNWESDLESIEMQLELSRKHNIYVVLKGAHTRISCPDGKVYFNSTGNPGMATAGSGDSLTGIILGLLAQSYSPEQACTLGVYLHGLAGNLAAEELGFESMIASDIIEHLSEAFTELRS